MDRRQSLEMIGSTVLGAASLAPRAIAGAAALPALNPADPVDLGMIHRKLAWSLDGTVGFWWLKGRRYAAVTPHYTPLWDMLVGTIFTTRDIDIDTYAVTSLTTTFYTDIATGQYLENFHNPVTGKDLKIPYPAPRASEQKYGRQGLVSELSMPGTTTTRNTEPGPAWIQGDDVWVRGDVAIRVVPNDPMKKVFEVEDLSMYFGSLQQVANPKLRAISAGQVFTDILNYPSWLDMGDRNGHYFSRCFGRKVFKQSDMPQDWQQLMREHYPTIANDPTAALKAV